MIPTKTLQTFNMMKALIACNSPQIAGNQQSIITRINKNGSMVQDSIIAHLLHPLAWDAIQDIVKRSPAALQLQVTKDNRYAIVSTQEIGRLAPGTPLAYMLT